MKELRGSKKDDFFDVTMVAYDGVEVWELIGTVLLDKIILKYDKNSIGLYRDSGLSAFKNSTWKNKKELTKNIQGLRFRKSSRI